MLKLICCYEIIFMDEFITLIFRNNFFYMISSIYLLQHKYFLHHKYIYCITDREVTDCLIIAHKY
jgi:hypothetical protein